MGYKPKHIHVGRKSKAPRKKGGGKKILITLVALVLVAAIGGGIWFGIQRGGKPVSVFSFENVGMTEFWGDSQESYGPVTTDRIQTVFLSDTQTITEILVAQGDEVKKGDALMTFDTTLSELELERKRLEVEKLKIDLDDANKQLREIRNMTPLKVPDYIPPAPEPDLGETLKVDYRVCKDERVVDLELKHDGTTQDKAVICWIREDYYDIQHINYQILEAIRSKLREFRTEWNSPEPVDPPTTSTDPTDETEAPTTETEAPTVETQAPTAETEAPTTATEAPTVETEAPTTATEAPTVATEPPTVTTEAPTVETEAPAPEPETPAPEPEADQASVIASQSAFLGGDSLKVSENLMGSFAPLRMTLGTADDKRVPSSASALPEENVQGEQTGNEPDPAEDPVEPEPSENPADDPTGPEENPDPGPVDRFYVVFKVTEGNRILGNRIVWQGMYVRYEDLGYSFTFFDADGVEDYSLPDEEAEQPDVGFVDYGGPYTASELKRMRTEQEKKVKEVELQVKMAEADYKLMQREVNDGKVYADFDGQVVSLITEDEARTQKQPLMKVSGGGGFYIQGSVSELTKDSMVIGQEVTVQDWSGGGTYTGTVQSIQDLPSSQDGWNGMGNPNASYYPFTVFVDGEADLQEGRYVNVTFSAGEEEHGVYLDNPFIRTEGGKSYVYVRGENGRLEKRFVTVGKSLWGSYTEILSGLTAEDFLAFPYGKDVKDGAPTQEGDISELYAY